MFETSLKDGFLIQTGVFCCACDHSLCLLLIIVLALIIVITIIHQVPLNSFTQAQG